MEPGFYVCKGCGHHWERMEPKWGPNRQPRVCPKCGSADQGIDQAKEESYMREFYGPVAHVIGGLLGLGERAKPLLDWQRDDSSLRVTDNTEEPPVHAQVRPVVGLVQWWLLIRTGGDRSVEITVRGHTKDEVSAQVAAENAIGDARKAANLILGRK